MLDANQIYTHIKTNNVLIERKYTWRKEERLRNFLFKEEEQIIMISSASSFN